MEERAGSAKFGANTEQGDSDLTARLRALQVTIGTMLDEHEAEYCIVAWSSGTQWQEAIVSKKCPRYVTVRPHGDHES
jgi:hypothetical protein